MATYCTIKSKLSGNVIDIQGASKEAGALLDAFPQTGTGNDNQLWEFIPDPTGYYFIKSKLSGNVIDIQGASNEAGVLLDAFPQKGTGNDNQLWEFIPDPSGYYFIRSKLSGNVIDIQGASNEAGVLLDAFPQKTAGNDNQLWQAVGGAFPGPVSSSISWGPVGTGPAPNSSTVGSDGNQCAYQVSVSIHQDGSCTFSGYYQNRGDVWWGTAPPQAFVVAFLVYDTSGRAYAISYSGEIPSAPQSGSLVTWNLTPKCPLIAENWYAIAARNSGVAWCWNRYDESIWVVLGQWVSDAGTELGTAFSDIYQAFEGGAGGDDGGGDGGDGGDEAMIRKPLPPLPAGAPTGAAAIAHNASGLLAGMKLP